MTEVETIKIIKKAILDKKGLDVKIIDVKDKTPFTNFYIVATANNIRQIDAIKDSVVGVLEDNKIKISHVEGKAKSGWVLIDAFHIIINIFSKEERERIKLEDFLNRNSTKKTKKKPFNFLDKN